MDALSNELEIKLRYTEVFFLNGILLNEQTVVSFFVIFYTFLYMPLGFTKMIMIT